MPPAQQQRDANTPYGLPSSPSAAAPQQQYADAPGVDAVAQAIAYHEQTTLPAIVGRENNAAALVSYYQNLLTDPNNRPASSQVDALQKALADAIAQHTSMTQELNKERQAIGDLYAKAGDLRSQWARDPQNANASPGAQAKLYSEAQNNIAQANLYYAQNQNEIAKGRADAAKAALDTARAGGVAGQEELGRLERDAQATANAAAQSDATTKAATARYADASTANGVDAGTIANKLAAAGIPYAAASAEGVANQQVGAGQKALVEGQYAEQATVAAINNAVSTGKFTDAQAAEILSLLDYKKRYSEAQISHEQANAEYQQLQTHQLQQGDISTKIEQLGQAVKDKRLSSAEADRAMEDYLSGSTSFQRQTQYEGQAQHALDTAMQYGAVVQPGQSYVPGFEPGGALPRATAALGVETPSVHLGAGQSVQQFLGSAGIQAPNPAAPVRFDASGAYAPQAAAPVPAFVPADQATPEQFNARAAAAAAQQPQVVPAAPPQATTAAMGGTFGAPRATQGIPGHTPRVQKPPLFARRHATPKRAPMFGRGT